MSARPGTAARPLRVAIIGAGPAGFYAAEALLRQAEIVCRVDIFDRLPTPFGLVRDGVAPDHQSIKKVTARFERIAADPSVRFFGNVALGRDLTREDLRSLYDQVVYAVGAQTDRRLGIPGEDLAGSLPATAFVGWYNGHPDYADQEFDLSRQRVVVVGNGNVAVDVCRILLRRAEELEATDIADYALEALRQSRVREVVMMGRRGPAQAKFTTAELKELGQLEGVEVAVDPRDLELDADSQAVVDESRMARRNLEILQEFAARSLGAAPRRLALRFLSSPVELIGSGGKVAAVRVERNRLVTEANGYQRSEGTGVFDTLEAGLVLRSVGYRGVPLADVPFDERRGVIPNETGRVTDGPGGEVVPREYVAGWIKRGPSGIIGTNKADAAETVAAMVEDLERWTPDVLPDETADVTDLLYERRARPVSFEEWERLDAEERARGEARARPRVKFTRVADMLEYLGGG